MLKIGIQGGKASFHDTAAHQYYEEPIETVPYETFRKLCEAVHTEKVDYALIAIENSIAGSILANYSLLKEFQLTILGEIKLRIIMHFMALPGQTIHDIKKVMSHYMALLQCQDFLHKHPWLEEEKYYDTADSAKYVKEKNTKGVAAIAGYRAAKEYQLEILASEIETIKENFTRFLVVQKGTKPSTMQVPDKAMLSFELPHQVGSLAETLQTMEQHHINLTKIQSVPLIGKPDEYTFYLDCEFENYPSYQSCMEAIRKKVINPHTLGEFQKGKFVYDDRTGS